jgi:hypothetical protein
VSFIKVWKEMALTRFKIMGRLERNMKYLICVSRASGPFSRSRENYSVDIEVLGNIWIAGSNVFKASMCTVISLYFSLIETFAVVRFFIHGVQELFWNKKSHLRDLIFSRQELSSGCDAV